MKPPEVIEWALAHGFRPTGHNAYSCSYEGTEYQILIQNGGYRLNRKAPGGRVHSSSKAAFDGLHIDEFGMLQGGSLAEAFVRKHWRDSLPMPPWITPEYRDHALNVMIPDWQARISRFSPAP
ncbi:hypothetical protein [Bosea sp. ANAM02]|uniref:hypothetical protein n=1 Tax=Bosea sp. ANAM02 TaxID=2020412 RepID=UPI00140F040A|nr:hypothetical protein [Bosea sp. ANAM02]BCB22394.1 hypothetical protein OCUBac02_52880 [Bosea sp. ANAM02]